MIKTAKSYQKLRKSDKKAWFFEKLQIGKDSGLRRPQKKGNKKRRSYYPSPSIN